MACQNRQHAGSIASVTRASAQDDTMTTSSPSFQVDPDIRVASTLDKRFYLDESVFVRSRERIFARSWQCIGDLADVASPGSLSPRDLLPGYLDESLLLARDRAGVLRCLSNVCTHRGNLLVHEPCRAEQIRCGYHSRRFDLAGRMTFMPAFEHARDFPSRRDDLPELPLGSWGPLGFVSVVAAAPLEAFLGDVRSRLAWLALDEFVQERDLSRDYEFDANWALYVENYLEGLHVPFVHPSLSKLLDMDGYSDELYRYANLQLGPAREGAPAFDLPPSSPDHGRRIAAYYFWIFPNLMLNFYPWGLSLNLVVPLGPARTRVCFRGFVRDGNQLGSGVAGALDQVELEDEAVVVAVQRGLRSSLYSKGRYSPTRERCTHHFHRLLCEFMADDGSGGR
jgi:choline monooxygenase